MGQVPAILADVHRGQYLDEGTVLTTLQSIDDAAYVDFAVAQRVETGERSADGGQSWQPFFGMTLTRK